MQAITAAANWLGGKYLSGCTIYVTVEPCAMCAGCNGLEPDFRLVYGTPDIKKGYTMISEKITSSQICSKTKGILEKECSELW
jgi:tRNA(adenine34) deaminase